MPEMRRVYNLITGEERAMYSVDADDAVRRHPKEWSFYPKKADKAAAAAGPQLLDARSPGVLAPGKDAKAPKGEPDGFGPELGGESVPTLSGETRMLIAEDDPAPPEVQPNVRRATKAEQIAASRADSLESAGVEVGGEATTTTRRRASKRSRS